MNRECLKYVLHIMFRRSMCLRRKQTADLYHFHKRFCLPNIPCYFSSQDFHTYDTLYRWNRNYNPVFSIYEATVHSLYIENSLFIFFNSAKHSGTRKNSQKKTCLLTKCIQTQMEEQKEMRFLNNLFEVDA